MRRAIRLLSLLLLVRFSGGGEVAFALSESDIQTEVESTKNQIDADWNAATNFACGGLLSPVDNRVLTYYARKAPLECILTEWCDRYDKTSGNCIGEKCTLHHWNERGVTQTTLLQDCSGAGGCSTTVPAPHQSCGNFQYFSSRNRHYECGNWGTSTSPSPTFTTEAKADCYTYLPYLHYDQSYYPFAYNCSIKYLTAGPVSSSDPKGQPYLIPPHELRPPPRESTDVWEPVQGSNLAVPSLPDQHRAPDTSLTSLTLDTAELTTKQNVLHPTSEVATRLTDYPNLSMLIGRFKNPPEVRLILPRGGFSLAHDRSNLLARIFESLRTAREPTLLTLDLGNHPNALLLAAEYLENIPLTEVRYVPFTVLAPFASIASLKESVEEWRTWLAHLQELAASANPPLTVDPALVNMVNRNIDVLHSYIALHDSLREYRLHFPRYLHALLTHVEESNRFFRDQWAEANAQRLRDWHTAYTTYLPSLQQQLRDLYAQAAKYTKDCLVAACRLDAIPVKTGASGNKPWDLLPEGSDLVFGGPNAAFLPEAPRLFTNYADQVLQWHPQRLIGTPLPDLTLDFSEVYLKRAVTVPLLTVEWQPLQLPYPPRIDAGNLAQSLQRLKAQIKPFPRLHPPLPRLTFPPIALPDPAKSLLLVPEAPKALNVWDTALKWRKKRLTELQATCDTSASPKTFLVHEFMLYGSKRDPAAVRAATLTYYPYQTLPGGARLPPLLVPSPCPECGMNRPQRYLRQHAELDLEWESLQENFLKSIDEWNAEVRYFSVVPRGELESLAASQKPMKNILQLLFSLR